MQQALEELDYPYLKKYVELIENQITPVNTKAQMLMHLAEFIFPKRRPEDSSGDAGEQLNGVLIVTDEHLEKLVKVARGER